MKMRFAALVLVFSLRAASVCAQSEDGFGDASKIKGEHFTIYYKTGIDLKDLLAKFTVSHSDELLSGQAVDKSSNEATLSSMMEVLFARAGDILDLHVYSYQGSIKIFPTLKELSDYYNKHYHAALPGTGYSFYAEDDKIIYISAEYFNREILGNEIGRAIMSGYFVVSPSAKIQEVLAGYVEYQLKKSE